MSFCLFTILAFTIVLPVISGTIHFRQVTAQGYLPAFLFVVTGFLNNLLSYFLIRNGVSNHLNSNIYVLAAFILLCWQFDKWNPAAGRKYMVTMIIVTGIWIADNFFINHIKANNSVFRFFAAFTILFMCVAQVNRQIFFHSRRMVFHPVFLISVALMVYYTFKAFVETFYFFSWVFETNLIIQINRFLAFADMVSNILISIAFLCMRYKPTYYLS